MKRLTLYAVALALIVSSFVFCAVAQIPTKPNKKTTGGQVSGSVTIRGKAAAGVVVAVRTNSFNPSTGPLLKATTNEDGKYHIVGIPAGTYLITPIGSAFIPSETALYGLRGKSVVIAEDESVDEIDFTLVRGGVITGKVTDVNGRPVIEEPVNLMPADPRNPHMSFFPIQTDDRGVYRIFGIPAGQYKVSVGQGDKDFSVGDNGRPAFRKTFFPHATDPDKANVVEVAEGIEATDIDITVGQTVHSFSASGRVVDGETGRPVTNMRIDLSRTIIIDANSSHSSGGTATRSDRKGEFTIENLVPGKYSVSIALLPNSELRADAVAFDVRDQNVTGLLIKIFAGTSVSGMVVIEGSHDKTAAAKLDQIDLVANVRDEGANTVSGRSSQIKTDGSFLISGLQEGIANFSLGGNQSKWFALLRIERDGAVQTNGIRIHNGEHLTGIRVILAYGTASIRGVIKLENGTLPAGGRLAVFLTKPPEQVSNPESPEVDSRGHFVIEGLVAGSYELRVFAYAPGPPQWTRSAVQLVTVAAGATNVTVTIDAKPNPAPTRDELDPEENRQ